MGRESSDEMTLRALVVVTSQAIYETFGNSPMQNGPLSVEEINRFEADGFLVPNFRLTEHELEKLQQLASALIANNPHLAHEPMACPHIPGSGVQELNADTGWIDYPTHPVILSMVSQLIGPDVIVWGTTLFNKAASKGKAIPWHRDGRYWPIKPLATTSVWIAVTDSTPDNGCLRCIVGSHADRKIGQHYRSHRDDDMIPETLQENEYDPTAARDIALEAGQMVIFDVYTAHGSNPNRSQAPRIGYAMRYMPSTSHYDHDDIPIEDSPGAGHHLRPLILARGRDRCGKNDFERGHPKMK